MISGFKKAECPPWCEVVLAYSWLRGDADISGLARRLAPVEADSVRTFARTLEFMTDDSARSVCRRILECAGLLRSGKPL